MALNENKNTQRSGSGLASSIVDPIMNAGKEFTKPLTTLHNEIVDGYKVGSEALKLTLSTAGIFRQMATGKAVTTIGNNPATLLQGSNREYEASVGSLSPQTLERTRNASQNVINDPINDCVFACGDYYAPLNINFSGTASKIIAQSQLVDGINIVERIANAPQTINVSFVIERLQKDGDFADKSVNLTKKVNTGEQSIYRLTSFLRDLYYNDEVFQVENPILNNELGISYAFIKSFNFTPEQGSTFMYVAFDLQEVNISDSLLYVNSEDIENQGGIPTIKK